MLTFVCLMVILGSTDKRAPAGFAPIVGAAIAGVVYPLIRGPEEG